MARSRRAVSLAAALLVVGIAVAALVRSLVSNADEIGDGERLLQEREAWQREQAAQADRREAGGVDHADFLREQGAECDAGRRLHP